MARYKISWGMVGAIQCVEEIEASNDTEALDVAKGLALTLVSYNIERLTPSSNTEADRLQSNAMQALLELQKADQQMFDQLLKGMEY